VNILVACERSGILRDALRAAGHNAISCDLKPSRRPGPHLECDVRLVLGWNWDGMVSHATCRYLTNAGVRWLHTEPGRFEKMRKGAEFFRMLDNGPEVQHIPLRAAENPIMHAYATKIIGRRADQFVHPWWFGSPFQKATGFHLHGLDPLPREYTKAWYAERGIRIEQAVWLMGPSEDREEKRSETNPQVARAIAQYWFKTKQSCADLS
jgi:hypothetical protein